MNSEIDLLRKINKYINDSETESSILISSLWGSGKTFFIQNYINELIESNKDINVVYFSLKGITNIQELIKSINLRLLIQANPERKENLASLFEQLNINTDDLVDIINRKNIKNVYKTVSMFSDVLISSLEKYLLKEFKGKHVVLFLDDLERISKKVRIIDLIAELSNAFVENNIKVVYIADENKLLKNKQYKEAKEKFIYRTYSFLPDKKKVFDDFSSHYIPREDNKEELYQMFIQAFDEPQPNLRSLKFAFSLYKEILDTYYKFENLSNYNHPNILYFSICAYANFYCKNQTLKKDIIQNAPGTYDYLKNYLAATGNQVQTAEEETSEGKKFFDKYTNKQFVLYYETFLIDYVYDGFLNVQSLKEFLYKKTNNSDPLIFLSENIYNLEINEIHEYFSKIKKHLETKNYSIHDLNALYNYFFKFLKYDNTFNSKLIIKLITESVFSEKNTEELNRYFMAIQNNVTQIPKFPDDFNEISKELEKRYNSYISETNKSQIEQLQEAVLNADLNAQIFETIDHHKIFSILVSNYFFKEPKALPNKSLNLIIYLIQRDILGVGNAYQFYTSEIPYLRDIQGLITSNLEKKELKDPLKEELLVKLKDTIDEAIKHVRLDK